MEDEVKPSEAIEAFLTTMGDSLKGKDDIDKDLAEILQKHLLRVVPASNAIAEARDAILKLAGERANPSKTGAFND